MWSYKTTQSTTVNFLMLSFHSSSSLTFFDFFFSHWLFFWGSSIVIVVSLFRGLTQMLTMPESFVGGGVPPAALSSVFSDSGQCKASHSDHHFGADRALLASKNSNCSSIIFLSFKAVVPFEFNCPEAVLSSMVKAWSKWWGKIVQHRLIINTKYKTRGKSL